MIHTRKTTQDILQEEMLRERAAVLARAGERLEEAFEALRKIETGIEEEMALCGPFGRNGDRDGSVNGSREGDRNPSVPDGRKRTAALIPAPPLRIRAINDRIRAYNRQREQVRLRLYYLIVTREAMGLIHHRRLEEIYRIPPGKRCLPEP